jgi:hypothetical protein
MGFKVDTSFLRFLTMGALGTRAVIAELEAMGFQPIELERYCTSNKLWATKVKRLRLPDLLCVKTGLKVEVRAKSALAIRMSDAPANPDRIWDAGADDEDVIAFVPCQNDPSGPVPSSTAVYFEVGALRRSAGRSTLGPAKSASEGAERDRTWPATVPSRSGLVLTVTPDVLVVQMDETNRRQTFRLTDRHPYVAQGDRFEAGLTFLAGAPERMADLAPHLARSYDPLADISGSRAIDRYAAAKAVRFRPDCQGPAAALLEAQLAVEPEPRVALEIAGTLAALGSPVGEEHIRVFLASSDAAALGMEAILILTEIGGGFAHAELSRVANNPDLQQDERRQAAIWGLGKAGVRAYDALLPHLADAQENVAFHAIAAFGSDTPLPVIARLIALLASADPQLAPAASESLRVIGGREVVKALTDLVLQAGPGSNWGMATLGRLKPELVRDVLRGSPLLERLEPMLLMAQGANWLAREDAMVNLAFLLKQTL